MVWICDSCSQPIKRPEDGWVEWMYLRGQSPEGRNLRLVHKFAASPRKDHKRCQFNEEVEFKGDRGTVADASLSEFVTIPRQSRGLSGLRPPQRGLIAIQSQKLPHETIRPIGTDASGNFDTPDNVKLLLPPRQSRGASLGRLGPDGLMRLLVFLADDELPKDEILEMIKRLHIPGYEEARPFLREAVSEGAVELNSRPEYPWQSEIAAVLEFIKEQGSR